MNQEILHHTVTLKQAFKMAELEAKIMDQEKEREDSREEERDKKRKLGTDDKEVGNSKKQKHAVVDIKLPTPTKDDEARAQRNSGDDKAHPGDAEKPLRQTRTSTRSQTLSSSANARRRSLRQLRMCEDSDSETTRSI